MAVKRLGVRLSKTVLLLQTLKATVGKLRNASITRNQLAERLVDIVTIVVMIESFIVFTTCLTILKAQSEVELGQINWSAFVLMSAFYLGNVILEFAYVKPQITSKVEELSPNGQYSVLLLARKSFWFTLLNLFGILMLVGFLAIGSLFVPEQAQSSLLFRKFWLVCLWIFIGFLCAGMPTILFHSLSLTTRAKLSFNLIRNSDAISSQRRSTNAFPDVWRTLAKEIVSRVESKIKGTVKASAGKLAEPFTIISFVAITGNSEQRREALKWMERLQSIVMNNEPDSGKSTKRTLIFLAETEGEFKDATELCRQFRVDYKLEPRAIGPIVEKPITWLAAIATILSFVLLAAPLLV